MLEPGRYGLLCGGLGWPGHSNAFMLGYSTVGVFTLKTRTPPCPLIVQTSSRKLKLGMSLKPAQRPLNLLVAKSRKINLRIQLQVRGFHIQEPKIRLISVRPHKIKQPLRPWWQPAPALDAAPRERTEQSLKLRLGCTCRLYDQRLVNLSCCQNLLCCCEQTKILNH